MNISPVQRQSLMVFGSTIFITLARVPLHGLFCPRSGPGPTGRVFPFPCILRGVQPSGGWWIRRSCSKTDIGRERDQDEYFSAFVVIRVFLLAFTITILLCTEPYLKDIRGIGNFFLVALTLVMSVFPNCVNSGVYGSGKVGIHQICVVIEIVVRVLLQITAVYLGYSIAGLPGGFVGGVIAGGIVNFQVSRSKTGPVQYLPCKKPLHILVLDIPYLERFTHFQLYRHHPDWFLSR